MFQHSRFVFGFAALMATAGALAQTPQAPPGVTVQTHLLSSGGEGVAFSANGSTLFTTHFGPSGEIKASPVIRGGANQVVGFGTPVTHTPAPLVECGIGVSPGGTLFWTVVDPNVPVFSIGQLAPGGTPVVTDVSTTGWPQNLGGLQFIPAGFPHAGELMIGAGSSFTGCQVGRIGLSPAAGGTFNLVPGSATVSANTLAIQAQGIAHIPVGPLAGNLAVVDFGNARILVVSQDPVTGNGSPSISNPAVSVMITGLLGRGLCFDPITNDLFVASSPFLFQFTGALTAIPLLVQSTYSASSGAPVQISANAGPAFAGLPYVIAVSLSGSVPGTTFGSVSIPINPDPMTDFVMTASLNNDPQWIGFVGNLNGAGVATAIFSRPAPIFPAWVGVTATLSLVVMSSPVFASPPSLVAVVP